jgi:ribosomal protein S12 methylthiotransferase
LKIITLGCSKNTVDTEHLLAQVAGSYEIIPESDVKKVDYLLLNTCGFIGDAKEESVNAVLEAVEIKKSGKAGKVIVFGCLSQRYMAQLSSMIPEVDGWYGARDLVSVIKALGVVPDKALETGRYSGKAQRSYAFLKISEGCDRRCSYCAIPFIRGAHRSVPIEKLVEEASFLADSGVKELVLIAQDTTYYGLDIYHRRALAELLARLSDINGIEWIRIHYSYPADFPEDVMEQMAGNPKVCRYMDIPLQHISDNVLGMMHRNIDGHGTRELIRKMREKVPGVVLRTTLIVGHPGEGRKEFLELLDFVREFKFERLGAFAYSEEEGTFDAGNFRDSVSSKTKKSRLEKLMSVQSGISFAFNQSRIGTETKVLVDDYSDGVLVCRSEFESPEVDGEILVQYDSSSMGSVPAEEMIGKFVNVRITGADEYDLIGEPVG